MQESRVQESRVQESTTPAVVELDHDAALTDTVFARALAHPDVVLFRRRVAGGWQPVTAAQFVAEVRALAKGLAATGVRAGDRVGLMSKTRYEWTLCDYAIWAAGAVTVPIYETSSAEQVQWNLGDSGAVALIVETAVHTAAYDAVRAQLPDLTTCWQIDADGLTGLAAAGRDVGDDELLARRRSVTVDSLATIIYTSGTTGRPKGCELTHGNLLSTCRSASFVLPEVFTGAGSTLLFLPLAHVFARLIEVACMESGVPLGHTADIANLVADLGTFRPTFIVSVPRIFEKVYNSARQKAHSEKKGPVFDRAEAVAIAFSATASPGLLLRAQHAVFDRVVYGKLRAALGGQVAYAISGGAPLGARLGHFFRGAGITILEGYGLTETTAAGSVNTPASIRIGSIGRPSPGVTMRIADDGEILMRGANVFPAYWRNPAASAEVLIDGWFHSGDIGELDAEGFVTITGRKKEIIVTAGGKNVAPAGLEDRLRSHPLVSQCLVVGDRKPFIACLITLDADAMPGWLVAHGRPADAPLTSVVSDPDLLSELQKGIDDANSTVSRAEAIRKFAVLPGDWTEEGGQLTPSLKLKRSVVLAEFGDEVSALYP